jgi:hypothetical protein
MEPFRINFVKGTALTFSGIFSSYYTHGVPIGINYKRNRYIFNIFYPKIKNTIYKTHKLIKNIKYSNIITKNYIKINE